MEGKTYPGQAENRPGCVAFLLLLVIGLTFSPLVSGRQNSKTVQESSLDSALKIINFLEEVGSHYQKAGHYQGQTAEFSEEELSAFFQEILSEGAPAFRKITLKLFPGNKVEGWLILNFKGMNLPSYLKEEVNLYFSAVAEIKQRKIRLNFDSLFLETQKVQPAAINALIEVVAASQHLGVKTLDSWYDLPEGILNLSTRRGKIIVTY